MKKNTKLSGLYLGIVFFLMYLPVAVVIIFSFNESRLPVRFTGFSLKWYQELLNDRAMIEALGNSLVLGAASCLVSAVIGTLGAVGLSRIHYKFIIYMDDLSFEEFEIEYKYLKAVIEGGLERKPDNILIYATSNRRHLVRERSGDKLELNDEDDLHSSDTVQEKLSLVYRFGVRIYFGAPGRREFQNIVKVLAERNGIKMPEEKLLLEAGQWELSHGGLTGRTAQQFIDHLLGRESES